MAGSIKRNDVLALKEALHDGLKIALLDAHKELTSGECHILMAACMLTAHRSFGRRHGAGRRHALCGATTTKPIEMADLTGNRQLSRQVGRPRRFHHRVTEHRDQKGVLALAERTNATM